MYQSTSENTAEIKSYKRRWVILLLVTFYLIAVGYGRACFGVVENVYANYYIVSVEAVDWLTLSMSAISGLVSFALLLILPDHALGFKNYCRIAATSLVLSFACHLIASFSRNFFALALTGQMLIGIVGAFAVVIIPEVAALWFPKEEIATAVGIALGGIAVGNMIGFLLPAHLLQRQDSMSESLWVISVQKRLTVIFSVLLICSLVALITTIICVQDFPEVPPSLSEQAKRSASKFENRGEDTHHHPMKYLKLVCNNCTFSILVVCFGVVETAYMLEVLMIAGILRHTRNEMYRTTKSNVLASFYLTSYAVGALPGGVVSGIILDRTKRFKEVAVISGVFMTLFAGGFLIAVALKTTPWSLFTNFAYGFFNGSCYTCLYEIIVQHMYPCNEMALGAWITLFVSLSSLCVPLLGRLVFNAVAKIGVLAMQIGVLFIATFVIACLKPNYERYFVNHGPNETMPLVTK